MSDWEGAILAVLPEDGAPSARADVEVRAARLRATPLQTNVFEAALAKLSHKMLIGVDARSVWRAEPDFDERALEAPVEAFLRSTACGDALRIPAGTFVLQKTTSVGAQGAGRWSRPDFTMAAIRSFTFDPRRYLDVFGFELKNRAGTSVIAVHEALAQARFSHYSYLICPRSVLRKTVIDHVRQACTDHGVGLITFELGVDGGGGPTLSEFKFEASSERRNAEPAEVDRQLSARFSSDNQATLIGIARRP